eukprot:7517539-Karenia_brevis.AAC.1
MGKGSSSSDAGKGKGKGKDGKDGSEKGGKAKGKGKSKIDLDEIASGTIKAKTAEEIVSLAQRLNALMDSKSTMLASSIHASKRAKYPPSKAALLDANRTVADCERIRGDIRKVVTTCKISFPAGKCLVVKTAKACLKAAELTDILKAGAPH